MDQRELGGRLRAFGDWCHDHGKVVAVVVALVIGLVVGAWMR